MSGMSTKKKQVKVYMTEAELVFLAEMRQRYGLQSNSATVNFALRMLAETSVSRRKRGQATNE